MRVGRGGSTPQDPAVSMAQHNDFWLVWGFFFCLQKHMESNRTSHRGYKVLR